MKIILFFLFAIIANCYNVQKALEYAQKYCNSTNEEYKFYKKDDSVNFISQCLIAGGESLEFCSNLDAKKAIFPLGNLLSCLNQIGWSSSKERPPDFKAGYLLVNQEQKFIAIATEVNNRFIKYCKHSENTCDKILDSSNQYTYYYR